MSGLYIILAIIFLGILWTIHLLVVSYKDREKMLQAIERTQSHLISILDNMQLEREERNTLEISDEEYE